VGRRAGRAHHLDVARLARRRRPDVLHVLRAGRPPPR
jgi:hypothetical protein